MGFSVENIAPASLTVFGGLVTETPPENLPEGVSPDNQDVVFAPGAVGGRPAITKVFASALGASTVTYAKSYVDPTGQIRNLYFDSVGNLWVESTFGTATLLGTSTPGCYAKSVTAFGREYIAISDGIHGQEVPLQYDGTNLDRVTQDGPGTPPTIDNLIIAPVATSATPNSLVRAKNVVTVKCAGAHGLQVGYMAQISGFGALPVGFITSITINNEDNPGIATVLMATPHGLSPGVFVSIQTPDPVVIGTSVNAASLVGDTLTVDMTSPHNLSPGAIVTITLTGGTASTALAVPFNATLTVSATPTADRFICVMANSNTANASATGGVVKLTWPPSGNPETTFWEVLETPSSTLFTVQITYTDGVWPGAGAGVFQPWDGTFFVKSVTSSTVFTYFDQGPDDDSGPDVGLVTPTGQAAPGQHQMQVLFLTRQGYITAPSPPVKFIANGGQYLNVTDIPIGPPNVVARILAFTGAAGAFFFYIPVPGEVNGQIVSTATQINDNTSTSMVLDFSDNTLFASLGINIPGNNLPAQFVLDSALGFGFFSSRLIAYGQRNCVNNLLNMGFDGGSCTAAPITGWTKVAGTLVAGHFSEAVSAPNISQSFYLDAYGAPIGTPKTPYIARAWMSGGGCTVTISSVATGFTSTATLTPGAGGWGQAAFSLPMPATIPPDMKLTLAGAGTVDHLSIIYADTPFLNTRLFGSYVDNPEAFDGVTGKFGSSDDTRKVMDFGIIRGTLYMLTQEPAGRLHSITANGVTEPAGWTVNEVGANCGTMSAFSVTRSQADDATGSGGEEWLSWASATGARIFGGDQPWKVSQEIQPDWNNINPAAWLTVWALNDPTARIIYWGLPIGAATAPNLIYPMDYRELDTAYEVAKGAPIHTGLSGKLIATDHVRKWTRWNLSMNGAALMYRNSAGGRLSFVLFAGNGSFPAASGFGNVYTMTASSLFDDDYGQMFPYYVTYFFVGHDMETGLHLGAQRKILKFFQFMMEGNEGTHVVLSVFSNVLQNQWPLQAQRNLHPVQPFDIEWPGGSAVGQRFAFKFAVFPGTV